ncbi:MAG TPA: TonB-dependent receptor, partial [Pedobacter sp.]
MLTLFSSVVSAQEMGRIRGKIVTSEGKAAEGISVQILDKKYGASTNSKGEYKINNVQPGAYTVKISAVGLMPIEKKISVAANQELLLDFTLAESYSQLEEVSVYAGKKNKFAISKSQTVAKMPLKNLENPQVYSSIPKALFQEQIITDFTTALRNSPGVYKIQGNRGINSDGATFYAVRGFRTEASLLDGVPGQTNGEIDPANIEKVEVMKGPSGTLYGGSLISFGGLINIVTKKPVDTVGGEVSYTTGSYNLNRFTADVYGPVNGNKKLLVR